MIKQENINEIQQYIIMAANALGWGENSKINVLISEVERQIRLNLDQNENRMRKHVEDAYRDAAIIYNTGHSILFYKRHDRQPVELKHGFNREDICFLRENKMKYITKDELYTIRERLKTDSSKRFCNPSCESFWRSEKNAYRFGVLVSFKGENFDYCDKSKCLEEES